MLSQDGAIVLAASIASAAFLVNAYMNMRLQREQIGLERFRAEMEYRSKRQSVEDPSDSLTVEFVARQTELLKMLARDSRLTVDLNAPDMAQLERIKSADAGEESAALVREIAHTLNTPLSQIEVAAALMNDSLFSSGENTTTIDTAAAVSRIQDSVEICKAFLTAFRQISNIATTASEWNPRSLPQAVNSAATVYSVGAKQNIDLEVSLSEQIPGYSNSFVLALLLPLLENAIESAGSESTISIRDERRDHDVRLLVRSTPQELPDLLRMYESGYSTKPDHQGLGLTVVQRLLLSLRGASLSHYVDGDELVFVVTIPGASRGQ